LITVLKMSISTMGMAERIEAIPLITFPLRYSIQEADLPTDQSLNKKKLPHRDLQLLTRGPSGWDGSGALGGHR
jgi:hypothetical protein